MIVGYIPVFNQSRVFMACVSFFFLRWCNILTLNKAPKDKFQTVKYVLAFL